MKFNTLALAAATLAISGTASADPLHFDFYGTIAHSFSGSDADTYAGQPITGYFEYDTNATATHNGIQDIYYNAVYINYSSPAGSASGTGYINVLHNNDNLGYDSFSFGIFTDGDFYIINFGNATSLPATDPGSPLPTDLNGLVFGFGTEGRDDPYFKGISGEVTIGASPVPEPASWALMIGGIGITGAAMRRRRKLAVRVAYA